jgi:hypothetical protein
MTNSLPNHRASDTWTISISIRLLYIYIYSATSIWDGGLDPVTPLGMTTGQV